MSKLKLRNQLVTLLLPGLQLSFPKHIILLVVRQRELLTIIRLWWQLAEIYDLDVFQYRLVSSVFAVVNLDPLFVIVWNFEIFTSDAIFHQVLPHLYRLVSENHLIWLELLKKEYDHGLQVWDDASLIVRVDKHIPFPENNFLDSWEQLDADFDDLMRLFHLLVTHSERRQNWVANFEAKPVDQGIELDDMWEDLAEAQDWG